MMKMRSTIAKSIAAVAFSALLAVTMMITVLPLNAYAEGGIINVRLADIEGLGSDFAGFTFELYEVGGYDGSEFILVPDYSDVNVRIPSEEEYDKTKKPGDPSWQEAWLISANTLANHIKHPASGESAKSPVKTFTNVKPGDTMTYTSDKNALYLLIGKTYRYDNKNYTPVPIFVRTLNGEETYTIDAETKVRIEPVVFDHSLIKIWDDDDDEAEVRPEAIEIGIYYGSQLIDKVVFGGDEDKWTYNWQSEETGETYYYITEGEDGSKIRKGFKPGTDDLAWSVKEFYRAKEISDSTARSEVDKLLYYTPEYKTTSSDKLETFSITNTCDNPPPPPGPNGKVKTGDQNNLVKWAAAAAVAIILLCIIAVLRKRKDS